MTKALAACAALALALPLAISAVTAAEDSKPLFERKCAMCHGKDGVAKPMAKGSGNFNDPKWQGANPTETIEKVISGGKEKMKGYKDQLTPEQIRALAAYIKTLG